MSCLWNWMFHNVVIRRVSLESHSLALNPGSSARLGFSQGGGSVLREVVEACKVSWGLRLERAQCPFCYVLSAKARHEAREDSRWEEMNSASWWDGLQCHIARVWILENRGHFIIIVVYVVLLHKSLHLWICFLACKNGKESNNNFWDGFED